MIAGGPIIRAANAAKGGLYGILLLIAAYWALGGLWLYVWDELVWIGGFAVIEMNVVEWRDELLEEEGSTVSYAAPAVQRSTQSHARTESS